MLSQTINYRLPEEFSPLEDVDNQDWLIADLPVQLGTGKIRYRVTNLHDGEVNIYQVELELEQGQLVKISTNLTSHGSLYFASSLYQDYQLNKGNHSPLEPGQLPNGELFNQEVWPVIHSSLNDLSTDGYSYRGITKCLFPENTQVVVDLVKQTVTYQDEEEGLIELPMDPYYCCPLGLRRGHFGPEFHWAGRAIPLQQLDNQPDLRVLDHQLTAQTIPFDLSRPQIELIENGLIYQQPGFRVTALKLPVWPNQVEVELWFKAISSVAWLQSKGLLPGLKTPLTVSYDWTFQNY